MDAIPKSSGDGMTPVVILSMICAGFIAGFSFGLIAFAMVWQFLNAAKDENSGAPEGAHPISQRGSSSPAR